MADEIQQIGSDLSKPEAHLAQLRSGALINIAAVLLESRDNAIYELGQLMKGWDDRLTVKGSFAKRYIEGRLEVLAEFDVLHHGYTHHFLAIFNRTDSAVDERHKRLIAASHGEVGNAAIVRTGNQEFVLIGNVEIVDCSKRIVPSVVRLQRPNYIDDIWRGAVYVSLFDHILKAVPFSAEREINVFDIPSVESNQIASEKIESGSKIMNSVPNYRGEIVRDFLSDPKNPGMFTGFRVLFDDDSIRLSAHELNDIVVQFRDVLFGPFNL